MMDNYIKGGNSFFDKPMSRLFRLIELTFRHKPCERLETAIIGLFNIIREAARWQFLHL